MKPMKHLNKILDGFNWKRKKIDICLNREDWSTMIKGPDDKENTGKRYSPCTQR